MLLRFQVHLRFQIHGQSNVPEVARTHNGLGNVREAQGDYEKALFHYEKAQEVFVATLGHVFDSITRFAVPGTPRYHAVRVV